LDREELFFRARFFYIRGLRRIGYPVTKAPKPTLRSSVVRGGIIRLMKGRTLIAAFRYRYNHRHFYLKRLPGGWTPAQKSKLKGTKG